MTTENNQILRELRAEISELEKDFNSRTRGLLIRIATELGEVKLGPQEIMFTSPCFKGARKVKCGRL